MMAKLWDGGVPNTGPEDIMTRWLSALAIAVAFLTAAPTFAAECGKGGQGPVTIEYATGQSALTRDHKRQLARFAETAKYRDWVCVFAQVDAQGSKAANKRLAQARAQKVKRFLISKGVKADRILIAREEKGNTLFGLLDDDQQNDRRVTVSYE